MTRLILFVVFLFGSLVTSADHANSMNKNDLVIYVAAHTGLSLNQAAEAVDAVFGEITETLTGGGDVRLAGFGTFGVPHRPATVGATRAPAR